MEAVTDEIEALNPSIGNRDALRVFSRIEFSSDAHPGPGGGADEVDDGAVTDQRVGAPVHADAGEQAMLDLVPCAGARRQVADLDGDARSVIKSLRTLFPGPHGHVVAAAIGADHHTFRVRIALTADVLPPVADRLRREGRGAVVNADADPAGIRRQIMHAIRDRPPQRHWALFASAVTEAEYYLRLPRLSDSLMNVRSDEHEPP
nr:hypothetical protein [Rhodopila globiformis]